jgi:hypothetical protein
VWWAEQDGCIRFLFLKNSLFAANVIMVDMASSLACPYGSAHDMGRELKNLALSPHFLRAASAPL